MIFREIRLPANPEGLAPLTLEQVWQGLEQKARDAVPYVEAITSCRVIAEESDTVFDREIELGGARYIERVRLAAPRLVVFTRLDGPVLGTITNEIVDDAGELGLRFQFALTARPGDKLPVSQTELATQMTAAYQVAVETTLAAVRARLVGTDTGAAR